MAWDIIIVQFSLGVFLFFIINWIGRHSYSIGYMSISIFVRVEEAPAFNFLIRVLTPIVYLILTAAFLYAFNLDRYVDSFYLVCVYYIAFRLLFNLATGRGLLLNWYRQFLYWAAIIVLSYFTYEKIIITRENLLPDFTTISNELWIIVLIFLFHVVNNVRTSQDGTIKRKEKYLDKMFSKFKRTYGVLIDEKMTNSRLKALAYSILIYENFNRPKLARRIERIRFRITRKPHTLGVMQTYSDKLISDKESVEIGLEKINSEYHRLLQDYRATNMDRYYGERFFMIELISKYNTGEKYSKGVRELLDAIETRFFNDENDKLLAPNST